MASQEITATTETTESGAARQWRYAGDLSHGEPAFLPWHGAFFVHESGDWNLNLSEKSVPTESGNDRRHVVSATLNGPKFFAQNAMFEAATTVDIIFRWADRQIEYLPMLWEATRESNERDRKAINDLLRACARERAPA